MCVSASTPADVAPEPYRPGGRGAILKSWAVGVHVGNTSIQNDPSRENIALNRSAFGIPNWTYCRKLLKFWEFANAIGNPGFFDAIAHINSLRPGVCARNATSTATRNR